MRRLLALRGGGAGQAPCVQVRSVEGRYAGEVVDGVQTGRAACHTLLVRVVPEICRAGPPPETGAHAAMFIIMIQMCPFTIRHVTPQSPRGPCSCLRLIGTAT